MDKQKPQQYSIIKRVPVNPIKELNRNVSKERKVIKEPVLPLHNDIYLCHLLREILPLRDACEVSLTKIDVDTMLLPPKCP